MKVGILTFHATTNYGATLQAYALSQSLKKLGHDVELIDYQPKRLTDSYFNHLYKNRFFAVNAIKADKFKKFLHSEMKLTAKRYRSNAEMNELNNKYDIVICGSDEIWNINSPHTGFDPAFFLDFVSNPNIRKFSYAPSFGTTKDLGENKEKIYELLRSFDAISVRDTNSLMLVKNEGSLQAQKVVDPTLLGEYTQIISPPKIKKDYILVYGGLRPAEQSYVKQVANMEGLDLIAIGYPCKTARLNRPDIGPKEWLGYFSKASYVFTNFYHGLLFSLIFRKPFTVFDRADKSVKVRDILSELNLSDRILTKELLSSIPTRLSYELALDEISLNRLINDSKAFIHQSIFQNTLV